MTDEAGPDEPKGGQVLARFLQDWSAMWREELRAQARNPDSVPPAMLAGIPGAGMPSDMSAAIEMWRAAMGSWADTLGASTSSTARSRDHTVPPRSEAGTAAPDARDAEIERLTRRIDELEARLAKLEAPRRRRG